MFSFLAHSDVPVDVSNRRLNGETHVMKRIHVPRYLKAGVKFVVMAAGGDQIRPLGNPKVGFRNQSMGAAKMLDDMINEVEEAPEDIMIIQNSDDFFRVLNSDRKIGILLHFEGGMPLEGNLFMLRTFYRVGLRSMQLGWYFRNELADSGAEYNPGGLSNFGRKVVNEMNRLGMVVDVSHLSEASALDVLKISKNPVMASHSNAKAIHNHHRNISNDVIKGIANNGGIIGIVFCHPFVTEGNSEIMDLIDHIDYIKEIVGVKHIALGPDFVDYAYELITGEVSEVNNKSKNSNFDTGFPKGLETVCELPKLINILRKRGYSEKETEMIMGGNLLRFFKSILK